MQYTVALVGNPNCGKTTVFNRLTGSNQRVGNWPGVTVDKKMGDIEGTEGILVDLPGIYSLSPYTPEEVVSRDYIVEERPDVVLNVVDATNLERNLYLSTQLLDSNIPTVIALNMMDEVARKGDSIDVEHLSEILGCPVVPISARNGEGIDDLIATVEKASKDRIPSRPVLLEPALEDAISHIQTIIAGMVPDVSLRWHAVKLLEKDVIVQKEHPDAMRAAEEYVSTFEKGLGDDADSAIITSRYDRVDRIVESCASRKDPVADTFSDRVDHFVMHKVLALPIFVCVIGLIYFISVSTVGSWGTDLLNGFFTDTVMPAVADWCASSDVDPILTGLLVDGIIAGVGAVIGFLPQMIVLFLLMCILEDIGYMSRIAFIMDRLFRHFGLSGKSFIPMIVATGCGVPGVMASRTIESDRDRRITAMTATFMPCGAKLPAVALIAAAFFGQSWFIGVFVYFLGIVCVLMSGIILKKWRRFAGDASPFVMELPPYHRPAWKGIFRTALSRAWAFVKNAGTIILLACVAVWFLGSFDTSLRYITDPQFGGSILEAIGKVICILFQPLGWGDNWQFTVATVTGLMAKENIIGSLATMFSSEISAGQPLWSILSLMLTPAAGLSFLVFNLICAPCFAAVGAMRRELGSWKDTGVAVAYQCLLAYAVSAILFVSGTLLAGGVPEVSSLVIGALALVVLLYLLIAKDPFRQSEEVDG